MRQYIVDAFTDRLFHGNQAAVCVVDEWPSSQMMQSIAKENRLSETAFVVREPQGWHLRWFTPGGEIDFCGHATLGTAFVLFSFYCRDAAEISFDTQVGKVSVRRRGDLFVMDFPAYECRPVAVGASVGGGRSRVASKLAAREGAGWPPGGGDRRGEVGGGLRLRVQGVWPQARRGRGSRHREHALHDRPVLVLEAGKVEARVPSVL